MILSRAPTRITLVKSTSLKWEAENQHQQVNYLDSGAFCFLVDGHKISAYSSLLRNSTGISVGGLIPVNDSSKTRRYSQKDESSVLYSIG